MIPDKEFLVKKFGFKEGIDAQIKDLGYSKELWPVVYILSDDSIKEAYVGETTDLLSRMNAHLKSSTKSKLTEVRLIASDSFNKSATLDIESNLIKFFSGDGHFRLQNANLGLANHTYYQKRQYGEMFRDIWNILRREGVAKHSIEFINNSDLFKYSPYKSLSKDQKKSIIALLEALIGQRERNIIVEGGAGTGKTVLAVFLFKLLYSKEGDFNFTEFGEDEDKIISLARAVKEKYPEPKMALVIPMASFRKTIKKVFKNVKGLRADMVIGPAELAKENLDIIIVDEAHRLRRRKSLGTYFGIFDKTCAKLGLDKYQCSELDWVLQQSDKAVLFYDPEQSIKPSDTDRKQFEKLILKSETKELFLVSQLRARGGLDYVKFVDDLLNCCINNHGRRFKSNKYELSLFDSLEQMIGQVRKQEEKVGLSRLVAGYSWPWVSRKDKGKKDINIDGQQLIWNTVGEDWVYSANAINEVGCIHTTQGYDLNYVGIIFGKEISYDERKNKIVILKENYYDVTGKTGIEDPEELKSFIVNIYKTLMLRAIQGTYIYVCDEKLRKYFRNHLEPFASTGTEHALEVDRADDNVHRIPFYDLKAAAGAFSEPKKVDRHIEIALPTRYKSPHDLFACKVIGESMNKVIGNGSICLFKKYVGGSRDGQIVLVELTSLQDPDAGSCYTVKEYHSIKSSTEDGWKHDRILLKPLTTEDGYDAIELTGSELQNLKVLGIFECVL